MVNSWSLCHSLALLLVSLFFFFYIYIPVIPVSISQYFRSYNVCIFPLTICCHCPKCWSLPKLWFQIWPLHWNTQCFSRFSQQHTLLCGAQSVVGIISLYKSITTADLSYAKIRSHTRLLTVLELTYLDQSTWPRFHRHLFPEWTQPRLLKVYRKFSDCIKRRFHKCFCVVWAVRTVLSSEPRACSHL